MEFTSNWRSFLIIRIERGTGHKQLMMKAMTLFKERKICLNLIHMLMQVSSLQRTDRIYSAANAVWWKWFVSTQHCSTEMERIYDTSYNSCYYLKETINIFQTIGIYNEWFWKRCSVSTLWFITNLKYDFPPFTIQNSLIFKSLILRIWKLTVKVIKIINKI